MFLDYETYLLRTLFYVYEKKKFNVLVWYFFLEKIREKKEMEESFI